MQSAYLDYQNMQYPAQPTPGGSDYCYSRAGCDENQVPPYFPPATYPLLDPGIFDTDTSLSMYTYPPPPLHDENHEMATYEPNWYAAPQQLVPDCVPVQPATHIHSPVPVSAYSTLLAHVSHDSSTSSQYSSSSSSYSPQQPSSQPLPAAPEAAPYIIRLSPAPQLPPTIPVTEPRDRAEPQDTLEQYDSPQVMFPTPSELLGDAVQKPFEAHPDASTSTEPLTGTSPSERPAEFETRTPPLKSKSKAKVPAVLQPAEPGKTENLRKSYFRSVADQVGFQPTDPDTITSHDKKRHYLECLEQYIVWLHEQIKLKGLVVQNMERIESYNGLESRSIRTLLVHMQSNTRKLHGQVVNDEHKYFTTEKDLFPRGEHAMETDAPAPAIHSTISDRGRRHSIANGMIPMSASSHVPSLPSSAPTSEAMATHAHA